MEANQELNEVSKQPEEDMAEEKNLDAESTEEVEEDAQPIQDVVAKLEAENEELKNKFLRNVADMENLRKRVEKEKSDLRKYGNEKLLEDILPVLDSFDKALSSEGDSASDSYVEGVRMVFKQLVSVTEKHGLKGFESKGQEFDPNFHQAIQKVDDTEVDVETVKDEFQKGYKLNDRLLRAAIVSVSTPSSES